MGIVGAGEENPVRILVVEDSQTLAAGLAAVLKGSGYAVDVVGDGASAVAVLATERFDLVILDLNLPQMDGLEVLRTMRGRQHDAAVLILSARHSLDERVKGLDLGADDYMVKPFDVGELEARVRTLLRRRAGLKAATVAFGEVVGIGHGDERPGHRLVESARGRGAAQAALEALFGGRGRPGDAIGPRQRCAGDPVEPVHADDFLDQVGRAVDIGPPRRRGYGPVLADREAEPFERRALLGLGNVHTAEPCRQARVV